MCYAITPKGDLCVKELLCYLLEDPSRLILKNPDESTKKSSLEIWRGSCCCCCFMCCWLCSCRFFLLLSSFQNREAKIYLIDDVSASISTVIRLLYLLPKMVKRRTICYVPPKKEKCVKELKSYLR